MPTSGRSRLVRQAVRCFLAQDYPNRELIIVDDPDSPLAASLPDSALIRYLYLPAVAPAGAKRHYGFHHARGEYFAFWDEDSRSAPGRLRRQLEPLLAGRSDLSALGASNVNGKTLVFHRRVWEAQMRRYPERSSAEEPAIFLRQALAKGMRLEKLATGGLFTAVRQSRDTQEEKPPAPRPVTTEVVEPPPCAAARQSNPLVTCIMPTADRRGEAPRAIRQFLEQDYAERELLILDDGRDAIADLVPPDPRIHYVRLEEKLRLGAKRNHACRLARGELIAHWDDDDWMAPWRLRYQVDALLASGADVCGLDRLHFYAPESGEAWEYVYPCGEQPWLAGGTMCYRKALWERNPFPDLEVGEDNAFLWSGAPKKMLALDHRGFYVAMVHPGNTSPKVIEPERWHPQPAEAVRRIMAQAGPRPRGRALVAAGAGIGDILRVTPLLRALALLGYSADLLLEPDFPEVAELLEPMPEARRVYWQPSAWSGASGCQIEGVASQVYDLAVFSYWARQWEPLIRANRKIVFDEQQWMREGDTACVDRAARAAGWEGPLPPPFAAASGRRFDLPANTVALHPGCKPNWPWKKWHGFDELAAQFASVVLIGTPSDLDNSATYFRREFHWPGQVRDFTGRLNLADTAALLRQCRALVSNDSGMMQLGVALGVPTFGIFGLTSPEREGMRAANFFPITKGLPCEAECHRRGWEGTDCEFHLECLKQLSAVEVRHRMESVLSACPGDRACERPVRLAFHSYFEDASGYGTAARGYVHALDRAGVELSVHNLGQHGTPVPDALVASLANRAIEPDFHLFFGVPPHFEQDSAWLEGMIAMTVWETDTMPPEWKHILDGALEVWLPSRFNCETFARALARPVFRLPYALPDWSPGAAGIEILSCGPRDFVIYSIMDWQERKAPVETILCYLEAFRGHEDTVLVLKTAPGAAEEARGALESARRHTGSGARVVLLAEHWSDAQITALHERGNCYISLHRGEGWGYPLFEAVARGKPVVATAFSGPLDYLDPEAHFLVPAEAAPVWQSYIHYRPSMKWAEPVWPEAVAMLRAAYRERAARAAKAAEAGARLRERYAPEVIGRAALDRLRNLRALAEARKEGALRSYHRQSRV